ncbi:sensor histidine kinase [Enterococcus alishanensis]|uniref:histidine kinase n=1 Tax=Enterococcus alishanensis TaxID=1303817 RepID=A0ABS6TCZ4_9ENTE|nr:sensor histidine kinase [Enterococcus alishanensis]MBV7390752.1 sensor histidine kinase [Enterococcus alishanensis]
MTKYTYWLEYLWLFIIGSILLFADQFQPENIWYLLIAILLVAPARLMTNKISNWYSFVFIFIAVIMSWKFSFFLPATLRIVWCERKKYDWLMPLCSGILILVVPMPWETRGLLFCLIVLTLYLSLRERNFLQLSRELLQLKDDSWEKQELLRQKNEELIDSRETFLDLEIAEERNRIARDIHDNVGHLLSSAIIQLGAIKAINNNQVITELLNKLEETIHTGMNSVRKSVHDLHADSLNLEKSVDLLLADFNFCTVDIIGKVPSSLEQTEEKVILTVIKEALSNVMKHSQATQVQLVFDELPAFYRLKILDNGKIGRPNLALNDGIGLTSMRQRIERINGQLHIKASDRGFQINIILPKHSDSRTLKKT